MTRPIVSGLDLFSTVLPLGNPDGRETGSTSRTEEVCTVAGEADSCEGSNGTRRHLEASQAPDQGDAGAGRDSQHRICGIILKGDGRPEGTGSGTEPTLQAQEGWNRQGRESTEEFMMVDAAARGNLEQVLGGLMARVQNLEEMAEMARSV